MKKVITVLMALTMVFSFAGIAAADCFNCAGTAGNIARGCESGQQECYPFDFESPYDYCSNDKSTPNRAVFKICDCITDGDFDTVVAGDTIDISMEILVNGDEGDNGVYWAEDVSSIELILFSDQDDACDTRFVPEGPYGGYYEYTNDDGTMAAFEGGFDYLKADDSEGEVYSGPACDMDEDEYDYRVVKLEPASEEGTGYVVQPGDETEGNATWVIDIPRMRVDPTRVSAGDQVWVRICLLLNCTGICSEDTMCCCDIYIGELCCAFDSAADSGLIYPYFPPANSAAFNLLGMTITNLASISGDATITMYEDDGDVGTLDVSVAANGIYLVTIADLAAAMTSEGTMGDAKSYLTVTTDFPATGFAMIADTVDGASMGYLPQQASDVYGTSMFDFIKD